MIEAKISRNEQRITAAGSFPDILTDLMALINSIYSSIPPELQRAGKHALIASLADPSSPVWISRDLSREGVTAITILRDRSSHSEREG